MEEGSVKSPLNRRPTHGQEQYGRAIKEPPAPFITAAMAASRKPHLRQSEEIALSRYFNEVLINGLSDGWNDSLCNKSFKVNQSMILMNTFILPFLELIGRDSASRRRARILPNSLLPLLSRDSIHLLSAQSWPGRLVTASRSLVTP